MRARNAPGTSRGLGGGGQHLAPSHHVRLREWALLLSWESKKERARVNVYKPNKTER